jgi:hypothetical protein
VVLIFFSVKLTALSARQTRILQALALMEQETREAAGNWSGNLDEEQSPQRSE